MEGTAGAWISATIDTTGSVTTDSWWGINLEGAVS